MLLIDDRAGSAGLIPFLPPELTKKCRLEGGDVAFFGYGPDGPLTYPIGIEYKTAKEALQCMHSGRLVGEQLPKMSRLYKRVYLLIEGEYKEGSNGELLFKGWSQGKPVWASYSKATYSQLDNWFNSLVEVGRITIKRSIDRAESATQIHNLYKFWTKEYEKHTSLLKFYKEQEPLLLTKPSNFRLFIKGVPGIGWELSKPTEVEFNSPQDMIMAGEDRWMKVNGIGKKKAQRIVQFMKNPHK